MEVEPGRRARAQTLEQAQRDAVSCVWPPGMRPGCGNGKGADASAAMGLRGARTIRAACRRTWRLGSDQKRVSDAMRLWSASAEPGGAQSRSGGGSVTRIDGRSSASPARGLRAFNPDDQHRPFGFLQGVDLLPPLSRRTAGAADSLELPGLDGEELADHMEENKRQHPELGPAWFANRVGLLHLPPHTTPVVFAAT